MSSGRGSLTEGNDVHNIRDKKEGSKKGSLKKKKEGGEGEKEEVWDSLVPFSEGTLSSGKTGTRGLNSGRTKTCQACRGPNKRQGWGSQGLLRRG